MVYSYTCTPHDIYDLSLLISTSTVNLNCNNQTISKISSSLVNLTFNVKFNDNNDQINTENSSLLLQNKIKNIFNTLVKKND